MRYFFLSFLFLILLMVYINKDLLAYGMAQAKGQWEVLSNARPNEEVLQDPSTADSIKQKIKIIEDVKGFAESKLGLTPSTNYSTFYDQGGKNILWNLSACEPYEFTPKTWSFPFLGSFPYKGFFDLDKAKKEREFLASQGYDTRIRTVGGWSTLGWFSDPILSNMLERSEGRLASLIIHELTHATLFVKDNIVFNENLASFIGDRGAEQFLIERYGHEASPVVVYDQHNSDARRFTQQMLLATSLLDSLYGSFDETYSDSSKYAEKHLLIDEIISSMDTISFYNERYSKVFLNGRPNNAYFMSFVRYHSSEDSLTSILDSQYAGDLADFIKGMKAYHE